MPQVTQPENTEVSHRHEDLPRGCSVTCIVGSSFLALLRRNRATKARSRGRPIPVTFDTAKTGVMRSEAMLSAAASTCPPHSQSKGSSRRTQRSAHVPVGIRKGRVHCKHDGSGRGTSTTRERRDERVD